MTAKIDMKKHGGRVKGSGDVPAKASGAGPNTGTPGRTPAPNNISAPKSAPFSYGQGGYAGPSSLTPLDDANKGRSTLGINMQQTSEGESDPVLNAIIQKGTGAGGIDPLTGDSVTMAEGAAGTQVRKIAAKAQPDAFGMESARSRQPTK